MKREGTNPWRILTLYPPAGWEYPGIPIKDIGSTTDVVHPWGKRLHHPNPKSSHRRKDKRKRELEFRQGRCKIDHPSRILGCILIIIISIWRLWNLKGREEDEFLKCSSGCGSHVNPYMHINDATLLDRIHRNRFHSKIHHRDSKPQVRFQLMTVWN